MKKYHRLCAAIRESKLLEKEALETLVSEFETSNPSLEESTAAEKFAEFLIQKEAITLWQAKLLLRGKFRGFFLGNYKILNLIGKGGMSTVYLVEHVTLQKKRALKILPNELNENSSRYERFIREARASASLEHPNIVRAFDIDKKGDTHFIVLEYVDGKDLDYIAKTQGPLDFDRICDFMIQACEGLHFAHESGMIHRDIKPANLILDRNGVVKVLDLGLALKSGDNDESEKAALTIMHDDHLGTADYLAPEQAINSHGVDARADIYSLGGTFYFLLTGKPPFAEGTVVQRVAMHQTQMPKQIRDYRPDCPQQLVDICWKMLQKKPENRYSTVEQVKNAISKWRTTVGQSTTNGLQELQLSSGQNQGAFGTQTDGKLADLGPAQLVELASESSHDLLLDGSSSNVDIAGPLTSQTLLDTHAYASQSSDTSPSMLHMTVFPPAEKSKPNQKSKKSKRSNEAELERTKIIYMFVGIVIAIGLTVGVMAIVNNLGGGGDSENEFDNIAVSRE